MANVQLSGLPVASTAADADITHVQQSGVNRSMSRTVYLNGVIRDTTEEHAEISLSGLANGTKILLNNNRRIGTIVGIDTQLSTGSLTLSLQIADQGGANATNITGLASLSVTTSLLESTASAANVMLKTGSADRRLQTVISSLSGSGELYLGLRYTRA